MSVLRLLTCEGGFIEDLAIAAGDQTGESVDAGDEAFTVPGNGEPGVGPELGSRGVGVHLFRALEAKNS